MTVMYIKLTETAAEDLNSIMMTEVVTSDGITFKFPYQLGTTQYIDPTLYNNAYAVDDMMIEVAATNSTVALYLENQKTKEEAIAVGWLPAEELL